MQNQYSTLFIYVTSTAFVVASFSVIWRKFLNDLPQVKRWILAHIPYPINRTLTCGFCFTYWLSLASLFIFNPLQEWIPPLRWEFLLPMQPLVSIFFAWMAVGFSALIIRFLFVALQELVDYEMYTWNKQFHSIDPDHKH
jgi:hypothetical protein